MNKTAEDIRAIVEELKALYPDGICSLEYRKDYELLFSVRLAAQCTDERVNKVTPALYARFPTLEALAEAEISEVEEYIHSTGFFRAKAKDIVLASQMLIRDYGGRVPDTMEDLLKLPGVGRKSAQRLAFHVINMPEEQVENLAKTMVDARQNVCYCAQCCTLTDQEVCPICKNPSRDQKTIMVVESPRDLAAYEKTGKYEGVYHVLHGAISPMLGIGPGDIRLKELMERLRGDVDEVIIATNSSLEGETTAMYISKLIKPVGIRVSRIASGVPVGGDLEYIDEVTLLRALEGRTEL